jgi:hypothetical protein
MPFERNHATDREKVNKTNKQQIDFGAGLEDRPQTGLSLGWLLLPLVRMTQGNGTPGV